MSTRNIYYGVKAVGAYSWQPYHLHVPTVLKSGTWNLQGLYRPVMGLLYLYVTWSSSCEDHIIMWLVPLNVFLNSVASTAVCVTRILEDCYPHHQRSKDPKCHNIDIFWQSTPTLVWNCVVLTRVRIWNLSTILSSAVTVSDRNHIAVCCVCGFFMRDDNCSRQGSHCGEQGEPRQSELPCAYNAVRPVSLLAQQIYWLLPASCLVLLKCQQDDATNI